MIHLENSFSPRNVAKPHRQPQIVGKKKVCARATSVGGKGEGGASPESVPGRVLQG